MRGGESGGTAGHEALAGRTEKSAAGGRTRAGRREMRTTWPCGRAGNSAPETGSKVTAEEKCTGATEGAYTSAERTVPQGYPCRAPLPERAPRRRRERPRGPWHSGSVAERVSGAVTERACGPAGPCCDRAGLRASRSVATQTRGPVRTVLPPGTKRWQMPGTKE
ncbi:hypothetical protein GCM10018773_33300 [Streptomyces candidus]|nr:hypothetical protein GCM10018773_33300 [Streptomyces candidus]